MNQNELLIEKNHRDISLDICKFIASIFVVFCHSILWIIPIQNQGFFMNIIWITQMPLFMIISGILSTNSNKCFKFIGCLKQMLKKFFSLLFPCLTLIIFRSFYTHLNILTIIKAAIYQPENILWFLWVLFCIEEFYLLGLYFKNKIKNSKLSFFTSFLPNIVLCIFLMSLILILHVDKHILAFDLIIYYTPFYLLGVIFKRIKLTNFYQSDGYKSIEFTFFLIFSFIVMFCSFWMGSFYSITGSNVLLKKILRAILGIMSSVSFLIFFKKMVFLFKDSNLLKNAAICGKYTLEIYYLHKIILDLLLKNYSSWGGSNNIMLVLCISISQIVVILFAVFFIRRIPFLHLLLFGKSNSEYAFEKDFLSNLTRKRNSQSN